MNKKVFSLVAVAVFCTALSAGCLLAGVFDKENEAENLYGKGVHAFFDANYRGAVKLLKKVEELGSEDPRPYFFLGIALSRLGKGEEAEATLKKAAALEWEGRSARDYNVSDAIKRIQGTERLFVESFRRQAKADWEAGDQIRLEKRYGQEKAAGKSILAQLAKGSELPPPEKSQFVGVAPFGARSVDPQRYSDAKDGVDNLVPTDDVKPTPLAKTEKEDAPKPKAKAAKKEDVADDDEKEKPAAATAEEEEKDSEDPFGMSDDEKKDDKPKKEEKKEEADDDDPFK